MVTKVQYCTKCKNICEEGINLCPTCKRSRTIRLVKENDLVFLVTTSEFEASEISEIFDANAVKYEMSNVKSDIVSSVYDATYNPTDKNIFVEYIDFTRAKDLTFKEEVEEIAEPPSKKTLAIQIFSVLAFLTAVALVTLGTDALVSFIKNIFG